tara:strand:+ start:109 stop:675 length:567 start_codon:yes stop_codon:yes gene_type:complete
MKAFKQLASLAIGSVISIITLFFESGFVGERMTTTVNGITHQLSLTPQLTIGILGLSLSWLAFAFLKKYWVFVYCFILYLLLVNLIQINFFQIKIALLDLNLLAIILISIHVAGNKTLSDLVFPPVSTLDRVDPEKMSENKINYLTWKNQGKTDIKLQEIISTNHSEEEMVEASKILLRAREKYNPVK